MHKISIIHFQPLEYFPPALNFIRYLDQQDGFRVSVFTTRQSNQNIRVNIPESVDLYVTNSSANFKGNRISRAFKYLQFNFLTILRLMVIWPKTIIYFDPYSAIPGIVVHLLTNRKSRLWIHFHEYFPAEWYSEGMLMARVAHFLEKRLVFRSALGISQTNADRVQLFLEDHPGVEKKKVFSFPNFPPSSWSQFHRKIESHSIPIRMVVLGSLTLKGTFIAEVCQWVEARRGEVELDIYSLYFDDETRRFLEGVTSRWIRFHAEGLPYDLIPKCFLDAAFDVGLILYKCNHLNTIHCVSNKFFEYLSCGLDVWYPREMIGAEHYLANGVYPKILAVNFKQMEKFNLAEMLLREGHVFAQREFSCEVVFSDWVRKLTETG